MPTIYANEYARQDFLFIRAFEAVEPLSHTFGMAYDIPKLLEQLYKLAGDNQAKLAEMLSEHGRNGRGLKINQPQISRWMNKKKPQQPESAAYVRIITVAYQKGLLKDSPLPIIPLENAKPEKGTVNKSLLAQHETETVPSNLRPAPVPQMRRASVPIRGHSMAGKDGAFQFGSGDIVGWADATEKLANVPGAYAVYVVGDSMRPALEHGFLCLIDPHSPPSKGNNVVVQISTDDGATVLGYIKRLVSIDERTVRVCQFNPEKTLTFPRKQVIAVHRVVSAGPPY